MADERRIVIEITDGSKSSSSTSKNRKSAAKRILSPEEEKKDSRKQVAIALTYYGFNKAKNLLMSGIELSLNRYYKISENYLFENEVNNVKTGISKGIGLASAIYAGAKVGTLVTPGIGTGVGVAIGAATYAIGETLSYQSKLSNYYTALNATKLQTEWGARRAGLYDDGRGTDN